MIRILSLTLSSLAVLIAVSLMILTNNYLNQDPSKYLVRTATPDFASFTSAKDKKQAFFDYLLPMVQASNKTILKQRARLKEITVSFHQGNLKKSEVGFLDKLASEYGIEDETMNTEQKIEQLEIRVDAIPESMALAQAAQESGWGTSRFAKDANNYFGHWCYEEGCGLVPKKRSNNVSHEVKKFENTLDAVDAYLKNLNSHDAYKNLRTLRAQLRANNQLSGKTLAEGLKSYSQRGKSYVKEIQSLIRFNNLEQFDSVAKPLT